MSHSKHTKRGYSLYLEKRDPAAKKYIHTCADAGVIVLHWSWMNGAAVRIEPGFWEKENRAPVLPGIWRSCIVQGRFFIGFPLQPGGSCGIMNVVCMDAGSDAVTPTVQNRTQEKGGSS